VALGDRLRRLDDNPARRGIVWLADSFGWWWNLGAGLVLVLTGLLLLILGRSHEDR
jgi:hypothetical protein